MGSPCTRSCEGRRPALRALCSTSFVGQKQAVTSLWNLPFQTSPVRRQLTKSYVLRLHNIQSFCKSAFWRKHLQEPGIECTLNFRMGWKAYQVGWQVLRSVMTVVNGILSSNPRARRTLNGMCCISGCTLTITSGWYLLKPFATSLSIHTRLKFRPPFKSPSKSSDLKYYSYQEI